MPIMDRFNLQGRTALVTGSSRGIGKAIALGLAECGADVMIHSATTADHARAVAAEAAAYGVRTCILQSDLSHDDGARRTAEEAIVALGRIDILITNASLQEPCEWQAITRESLDRQVAVNFRSTLELIQLLAPAMLERRWGRILTVGSVQEAKPHPQMVVYAATKAAQTSLMHNFAKQFATHGVTVNNLAPGVINTDRSKIRLVDSAYRETVLSRIPAGFIGEPEDCVGAALLLCSDAGRYITGLNLFADGGMSL